MSFLNAGLLGLGALFAVPLIIHLLNRRRYKRVPWAAMEFLLRAYKQNRRRLRLESLLLLLLRCAIPILLALAVARPRLQSGVLPASSQGPHHIFVLDRSYSMAYRSATGVQPFDRMKQLASALIDSIAKRPNEKVSLVYMGLDVSTPVRGDLDVSKAQKALARLDAPSDGRAELRPAIEAATKLANAEPEPARIYILSDFQRITFEADSQRQVAAGEGAEPPAAEGPATAKLDPFRDVRDMLADLDAEGADVVLFPVAPRARTSNTQVVQIELDPENAVASVGSTVRAELLHRGTEPRDVLARLSVDGGNEQTRRIQLRPDESTDVTFSVRFLEPGMHAVALALEEDGLPVDDSRRLVTNVRDRIRVLLVEGRDTAAEDEILTHSFLFRYLLDPTQGEGDNELRTFQTTVVDEDRFQTDPSFFQNQDVIALFDVSAPRPGVAKRLTEFVARGGGLLLVPGPNSLPDLYNFHLFGVDGEGGPLPLRMLQVAGYQGPLGSGKGAQIPSAFATPKVTDLEHPMLADFRVPELRTFLEAMPVFRYWGSSRVDKPEDTAVLLELAGTQDQYRPALVAARRYGQGESLLLTSNLSRRPDRWNRLDVADPLSFPLVHSMAHYLAREPKDSLNRLVGEPLMTWIPHEPSALYMTRPGDRGRVPLPLPKAGRDPETSTRTGWDTPPFEDTAHAGIYRLGVEFTDKTRTATEILFAVNPDPREGVLDYVLPEALERELPTVQIQQEIALEIGAAIDADTAELGRWFLILALLAALGESVLASFIGGRKQS